MVRCCTPQHRQNVAAHHASPLDHRRLHPALDQDWLVALGTDLGVAILGVAMAGLLSAHCFPKRRIRKERYY
jgi:hypothetical protein